SGVSLFQKAERAYASRRSDEAFELYEKAIKKILKDENVAAKLPAIVPDIAPQETLGYLWQNFTGFLRDPQMNYTAESSPEAFKLLNKFRPAKILLKGLQIIAGMTLGLLAWDKKDRPTASKRYREALDLAKTHPPYGEAPKPGHQNLKHFELYVATNNDTINAARVGPEAGGLRKESIPIHNTRFEPDGSRTVLNNFVLATDRCAHCGKRDVKLSKCSRCLKVANPQVTSLYPEEEIVAYSLSRSFTTIFS
ncbi:hypothetical protein BT96DRAFT_919996, partial [Gymnopus androsaceus JB14]